MSTIEEFENAPIGATASNDLGHRALKTDFPALPWTTSQDRYMDGASMVDEGFTLDPAPTNSREALDLAWELAYPVKEGQHIPPGTRYVLRSQDGFLTISTVFRGWTPSYQENVRTLSPLPEPEPSWLDAPAVMARGNDWVSCADPQVFSRENKTGTRWIRGTKIYRWTELTDVTPLYPKEDA